MRKFLQGAALAGVMMASSIVAPTDAHADAPGCISQFWWTLGSTQRTICDGPIQADGSWHRWREFWTPAHRVPLRTYCSGGSYYSSCSTTGGYFQERTSKGIEDYPVTVATVLHDEPGHIA